MVQGTLISLQ